jgi:hypothetical protein
LHSDGGRHVDRTIEVVQPLIELAIRVSLLVRIHEHDPVPVSLREGRGHAETLLGINLRASLPCAYISLDNINAERGLWGGDGVPIEEWERTHALAHERLATWMATGKDAVVDDVNFRWLRDRWRAAARSSCYRTVVIIPHTELVAASREPGHRRAERHH